MSIDDKISQLFEVVQRQKADVETAEKESKQSWKTNCSFQMDGVAAPINIQTANEASVKKVAMTILQHRDYARQVESLLDLPFDGKVNGFSHNDWLADCKKRITVMGLRAKKAQLEELETRLNAIISPEQRRQMELEAITKSLGV